MSISVILTLKDPESNTIFSVTVQGIMSIIICSLCSYGSKRRGLLKNHILGTHCGVFVYKCSHCDYRSNNKANANHHQKTVHEGERGFAALLASTGLRLNMYLGDTDRQFMKRSGTTFVSCVNLQAVK